MRFGCGLWWGFGRRVRRVRILGRARERGCVSRDRRRRRSFDVRE
jgi:hypothetical protein